MTQPLTSQPGIARRWVIAAMTFAAVVAGPTHAGASPAPSVTGSGSGPLEADRVQLELTARGTGTDTDGRFTIVHHTPDGVSAKLSGTVDCLGITDSTAVVTGTITHGFDDLGIDPVGERVSLVIHGGSQDSLEMDVSFVSGHAIPPCSADPILTVPLDRGVFRVRP